MGTHDVLLEFEPNSHALLQTFAIVTVTVTASDADGTDDTDDTDGGTDGGSADGGSADGGSADDGKSTPVLPATGGDPTGALMLAIVLFLCAGGAWVVHRVRADSPVSKR